MTSTPKARSYFPYLPSLSSRGNAIKFTNPNVLFSLVNPVEKVDNLIARYYLFMFTYSSPFIFSFVFSFLLIAYQESTEFVLFVKEKFSFELFPPPGPLGGRINYLRIHRKFVFQRYYHNRYITTLFTSSRGQQ